MIENGWDDYFKFIIFTKIFGIDWFSREDITSSSVERSYKEGEFLIMYRRPSDRYWSTAERPSFVRFLDLDYQDVGYCSNSHPAYSGIRVCKIEDYNESEPSVSLRSMMSRPKGWSYDNTKWCDYGKGRYREADYSFNPRNSGIRTFSGFLGLGSLGVVGRFKEPGFEFLREAKDTNYYSYHNQDNDLDLEDCPNRLTKDIKDMFRFLRPVSERPQKVEGLLNSYKKKLNINNVSMQEDLT